VKGRCQGEGLNRGSKAFCVHSDSVRFREKETMGGVMRVGGGGENVHGGGGGRRWSQIYC